MSIFDAPQRLDNTYFALWRMIYDMGIIEFAIIQVDQSADSLAEDAMS
jgi:hypothetical protein